MMLADALAERGRLSGVEVDALIGGVDPGNRGRVQRVGLRMVNPEQLRARAEECEAKAETALDPEVRLQYRDMAAQRRRMAQQHEDSSRSDISIQACPLALGDMACSLMFRAPCQLLLLAGHEHSRTIPLTDPAGRNSRLCNL